MIPSKPESAWSSPTANADEEPIPDRAGRSPSWWISTPSTSSISKAARTAGWSISDRSFTSSILDQTIRVRWAKNGGSQRALI